VGYKENNFIFHLEINKIGVIINLMGNSARNKHQKSLHFVSRGNGGLHADFTKTTITETNATRRRNFSAGFNLPK